jgi:hypothetical protein
MWPLIKFHQRPKEEGERTNKLVARVQCIFHRLEEAHKNRCMVERGECCKVINFNFIALISHLFIAILFVLYLTVSPLSDVPYVMEEVLALVTIFAARRDDTRRKFIN